MILGFKQQFPDGTPTDFERKILDFEKIHSIRNGFRWRPGMSIQMAFGVRTKNYRQFNAGQFQPQKCLFVQKIYMEYEGFKWPKMWIAGKQLSQKTVKQLIKNDGLTKKQFIDWFFPGTIAKFHGQIIHWTDFKY